VRPSQGKTKSYETLNRLCYILACWQNCDVKANFREPGESPYSVLHYCKGNHTHIEIEQCSSYSCESIHTCEWTARSVGRQNLKKESGQTLSGFQAVRIEKQLTVIIPRYPSSSFLGSKFFGMKKLKSWREIEITVQYET
jgi:hypothetical protein